MPISPVIDGYIYNLPDSDDKRYNVLTELASLIGIAKNWDFISADTNYPEYWTKAKTLASQIHTSVETILSGCIENNWPLTAELLLGLAPPGNVITVEQTDFYNVGALWNVWAAQELYLNPNKDINNYWNNTFAAASTWNSQTIPTANYSDPTYNWDSGLNPGDKCVANFTTVPFKLDHADPSNTSQWNPSLPWGSGDIPNWHEDNYRIPESILNIATSLDDSQEYRNFLVQTIYDFRNLALPELQASVQSLTQAISHEGVLIYPSAQVLKNPALQDAVFFQYALTGEGQLQRELGETADQMKTAEDVLTGLNLVSKILAVEAGVDMHIHLTASGESTVYTNRGYLLSGYSMLKIIYDSGRIVDADRREMIASVLRLASHAVSLINKGDATAKAQLASWWNGNKASNLNNNAISQWENQNDTLKQQLKKAIFIYQEFIKSASSVMRKLNQIVKMAAQDIRGR